MRIYELIDFFQKNTENFSTIESFKFRENLRLNSH